MNENRTEELSEYLDGSLDEATAGALEARLEEDAELRAELDSLRAVKTAATEQVDLQPAADLWS